MTFFALGFDEVLGDILDFRSDNQGLLLDQRRIPKRIRPPKATKPL